MAEQLKLIAGGACTTLSECPAVLELPDGRLAVIGPLVDDTDPERTRVLLPADILHAARVELNRFADRAQHDVEAEQLREHHAELRERRGQ